MHPQAAPAGPAGRPAADASLTLPRTAPGAGQMHGKPACPPTSFGTTACRAPLSLGPEDLLVLQVDLLQLLVALVGEGDDVAVVGLLARQVADAAGCTGRRAGGRAGDRDSTSSNHETLEAVGGQALGQRAAERGACVPPPPAHAAAPLPFLPPRIVRPGRSTLLPGPNAPHAGTQPGLQHAPPRSPSTTRLLRATGACAMLSRCSAAVTPRKPLLALPNTWAVGRSCRAAMLGCVSPPPGHSHSRTGVQGWWGGNVRVQEACGGTSTAVFTVSTDPVFLAAPILGCHAPGHPSGILGSFHGPARPEIQRARANRAPCRCLPRLGIRRSRWR